MAVYAIGDIQGCLEPLHRLLGKLGYRRGRDRLWLSGDLVNRGPDSLGVLHFVRSLEPEPVCVLGNHDLHLLAVADGAEPAKPNDTLAEILAAPEREELVEWLRQRPLFHYDQELGWGMVHAGLVPQWDLATIRELAQEVETVLRGPDHGEFFRHMYGNQPAAWASELTGWDRLRAIINAMTRLRYCDPAGHMALAAKDAPGTQPRGYLPWFQVPGRASADVRLVFGHWSTLGRYESQNAVGLDSGCVWGGRLTAVRLDGPARTFFDVPCPRARVPGVDG